MSIESQLPAGLQSPVAERLQAAAGEHVVRRLWERDGTLWAPPGTPEVTDRLGWLDIAERLSAEAGELKAFGAEVRDAGITDAVLLGHGRLQPRARGAAPLVRGGRDPPARARLHAPGRDPPGTRRARSRHDAVHRLLQVRRHDRDDVAVQVLPLAPGRRRALRRRHRPRDVAGAARRRARLPPRVRERPGHRRALLRPVLLRARAGGDRRLRRRRRAGQRGGGDGGLPRRAGQPGPRSSASRSASWRGGAATS